MFSFLFKQKVVTAKLVSRNQTPYLLATFYTSTPPMIWQMDLEKSPSFTVSLREQEGEWDIGYTPAQEEYVVVAHFDERGDAQCAYASVQKALSKSLGGSSGLSGFSKFLLFVAFLAALFFAVSVATSFIGNAPVVKGEKPSQLDKKSGDITKPGEFRAGVPVAADDVLPR